MYAVVGKFNKSHLAAVINVRDIEYLKALGANLRRLRMDKGLSQEKLELEAGLGKTQIGRIERGEVNVSASTIKRIADTLGIPPKNILDF